MKGRNPWGEAASYRAITARLLEGWRASKVRPSATEFTWQDLQEKNPDVLALFYLAQNRLRILEEGAEPPKDCKIIYLV